MGESNAALGKCKEESAGNDNPSHPAIDVVSVRTLGVQHVPIAGGSPPMQVLSKPLVRGLVSVLACVMLPFAASAAVETPLTKEQIKQFLQTAEIIKSAPSTKGVTHPWRLTLSNGTIAHDAAFQPVDEHKAEMKLESGKVELGSSILISTTSRPIGSPN